MSKGMLQTGTPSGSLLGTLNLMERLLKVRKRKRAWAGQVVDRVALQQSTRAEQPGKQQA